MHRKGGLLASLNDGKTGFYDLELSDQCRVLQSIISSFAPNTQTISLSLLGGAAHAGMVQLSKNIDKLEELVLVNQSITGLYENEVDLLHL